MKACRIVDIFSPNYIEATALFEETPSSDYERENLEKYAFEIARHVAADTGNHGAVVIRAGAHGSLTSLGPADYAWLPAFYEDTSPKVLDPTGAGNAFLGGFIAGWLASRDIHEASMYGNVAASFAIEQIGLPTLKTVGEREFWNGDVPWERLNTYKKRVGG